MFVRTAAGFGSKITLENLDRDAATPIDAKSIIAVMSSGVSKGHRVAGDGRGPDEDAAIDALARSSRRAWARRSPG